MPYPFAISGGSSFQEMRNFLPFGGILSTWFIIFFFPLPHFLHLWHFPGVSHSTLLIRRYPFHTVLVFGRTTLFSLLLLLARSRRGGHAGHVAHS